MAKRLVCILVVILFFTGNYPVHAFEQKQINIVFRYDDFLSYSGTFEIEVLNIFKKFNIKSTLAVSPYTYEDENEETPQPLDAVKPEILKKVSGTEDIEIALHGFSHRSMFKNREKPDSEFEGLDYSSQMRKLREAKEALERFFGVSVKTFVPPWNSYDINTLIALEKLGFKTISADKNRVAFQSSKLKFLPKTCNIIELRRAVEAARHIPDAQPIIVCLFHSYDFSDISSKNNKLYLSEFNDILAWIANQKDVVTLTIDETAHKIPYLSPKRYLTYNFYGKIYDFIPVFLAYPIEIYLSEKLIWISMLKFIVFSIFILAVIYACVYSIRKKFLKHRLRKIGG